MNRDTKITTKIARWLLNQSFYHGYLPREDLPYILKKRGDYIVRTTERPTGKGVRRELVLSIAWPESNCEQVNSIKDVKNIVIERTQDMVFIDPTAGFPSLGCLFDYYKLVPIKIGQKGLSVRLVRPVPLASWEFRHSQVMLIKKVGQGCYGEVFKGKLSRGKSKKIDVAVKTMRADAAANEEILREVMGEARLMRQLNHPNIVRIRGVALLEQPIYIIIDFITGGGLDSYLKKNGKNLSMDDRNRMAIAASWGLEFMHSRDIMHRDVAARNCLYDSKNYLKLSDFGLSRKGDMYKMKKARKMPTKWLAPESLKSFVFYKASDVYTFGVLLYEIYTCLEPYHAISGGEARKRILAGEFLNFEKSTPPELWQILKKDIFILEHTKRATMKSIVKQLEEWLNIELELDAEDETAAGTAPMADDNDSKRMGASTRRDIKKINVEEEKGLLLLKKKLNVKPVQCSKIVNDAFEEGGVTVTKDASVYKSKYDTKIMDKEEEKEEDKNEKSKKKEETKKSKERDMEELNPTQDEGPQNQNASEKRKKEDSSKSN